MIRVAVVEDHPLSRQGLVKIIDASNEMELVAVASSVREIEDVGYESIQVVLLDLHLPDADGISAIRRVRSKVPAVLIISATNDHRDVVGAIGAGANGYLSKGASAHEILRAVTAVAHGGGYFSPMLASHLLRDAREAQGSTECSLSDREREILVLVAQGETLTAIARQISIDESALGPLLERIREKTERRYRVDL